MFGTRLEVVHELREMALCGRKPSEMLRKVLSRHPDETLHPVVLCQYFTEAFCFADGEASPIHGWFPDGTGELKDSNIDYLMSKRIEKYRHIWEQAPRSASST